MQANLRQIVTPLTEWVSNIPARIVVCSSLGWGMCHY